LKKRLQDKSKALLEQTGVRRASLLGGKFLISLLWRRFELTNDRTGKQGKKAKLEIKALKENRPCGPFPLIS
jgi:hypothetical protein